MIDKNKIDISNLDFFSIKNSLIGFLSTQDKFKGYSFEGSALNILMDLLSYNTYYNGMYNNFVLNESFIDSAIKRNSVVSLSKHLGYVPKSAKPAKAIVTIKQDATDYDDTLLRKNTIINAVDSNNNDINFVLDNDYTMEPYELNSDGSIKNYAAKNVTILQGIYNSYSSIISNPLQKIELPFENIDIDSIRAFVIESTTSVTGSGVEWKLAKNIVDVNQNSKVFFINEGTNGFYEVQFGDGVFGEKLALGNVVLFEFFITSGNIGNDIGKNDTQLFSSFNLNNFEIETIQYSTGGSNREDIESIRRNALRNFSTQERAVTSSDYEAVILKLFGSVESVRCWGGEDNDPPEYGKVFATIKPKNAPFLTPFEKKNIIETLMTNKSVVGMNIEIKDPDILYLNFNVNIKYDPTLTIDSEETIKNSLYIPIVLYAYENYKGFDDDFFSSDFINQITGAHSSIVSVSVVPIMEKRIYSRVNILETHTINFENEIHPDDTIHTTGFYTTISENGSNLNKLCYIEEVDGDLKLYYYNNLDKKYVGSVGVVNKTQGTIVLSLIATQFENNNGYISIMCKPKDVDVFTTKTTTLSVDPLSDRVLTIDMKKIYRNTNQSVSNSNR